MIRLFVIEDHLTVIISSLRFLFRPGRDSITVAGFAATVEETLSKADPGSFDLFILDLYIPGTRPVDNIRKLKEHFPGKPIAIYTSETASSWRKRMMEEGANTYITKDASRDELKTAIEKASRGELFYFGQMDPPGQGIPESNGLTKLYNLTPVQHGIVTMLRDGLSHKEIAARMGLSLPMIEKILGDMRKKFKVKNTINLVTLLSQSGSV